MCNGINRQLKIDYKSILGYQPMKAVHDPRYIEIIARIRTARKGLGISQAELARRLGKPQSYVSKIEKCERRIDLVEALTLCDSLCIRLEAIIPTELKNAFK